MLKLTHAFVLDVVRRPAAAAAVTATEHLDDEPKPATPNWPAAASEARFARLLCDQAVMCCWYFLDWLLTVSRILNQAARAKVYPVQMSERH